jgi:hypothetical protein
MSQFCTGVLTGGNISMLMDVHVDNDVIADLKTKTKILVDFLVLFVT